MYYKTFEALCEERNVRPGTVSRATGISTATLTNWKQGKYTPKLDKLQKIADYFGVTVDYLMTGEREEYYLNKETAEIAQKIFQNRGMRTLFDAAQNSRPEDLKMAADLLERLKGTNPDA